LRFLNLLFWLVLAVLVTMFANQNWRDVTIDLWGNLQADVKLPVLLAIFFLIGFLPTWLICRARLWRLSNRVSMPQRQPSAPVGKEPELAE
jgi:putative membrane protein